MITDKEKQQGLDDGECSCGLKDYVTQEEIDVLQKMRSIKEQVWRLKRGGEVKHSQQIAVLREEWKVCKEHYRQANRRKLILLGHIPPDEPFHR